MNRSDLIWHLVDSSAIGGIESHIALLVECQRMAGLRAEAVLFQNHPGNPWLAQLADRLGLAVAGDAQHGQAKPVHACPEKHGVAKRQKPGVPKKHVVADGVGGQGQCTR